MLVAALLGGCLSACSNPGKATAPTRAQAQDVLNSIARDVLVHNSSDAERHLDPSAAAATFRGLQMNDLANLADVPLASWSYTIASVSTDPTTQATASRRLGAPALIAQVTLGYQLPGVDVIPSTHDLWLTFDKRGATTYLAGDSDLASSGFPSWVGPWRYGRLAVARGVNCIVLGPAGKGALLQVLATEVDAAIPRVAAVVGATITEAIWPGKVAVIVPSSAQEFITLTGGNTTTITDTSAAAVTDGVDPVTRHAYGQRLVLNPANLDALTKIGREIVLRHEITHLAMATLTSDETPRWLVEGFAEYVANLGTGQPVAVAASELATEVRARRLPSALPADTTFLATTNGTDLARLYEQSWLACRYLARLIGGAGVARFYAAIGQSIDPAAVALGSALRSLAHLSVAAFTAGWRSYVQTQLS